MRRMQTLSARNVRRLGKHGQPMKAPDGEHGGGGDSGGQQQQQQGNGGENNQGSNSGGGAGSDGTQNNGGKAFDASSFWNQPSPEASPPPNSGSAGGSESGGGQQQQNEGNAFAERLNNLKFGTEVFTPDAIKAMNDGGDPAAFNTNMQTFGRQAVRESVVMAAQLMQRNNSMMEARIEELLDARLGQRDSEGALGQSFPSYKEPGMKPVIDGIFAQAMKLSKGNRTEAIAATKEMLRFTHGAAAKDLGLTTPPGGAGDGLGTQTNWEEELLGRG